MLTRSVSTDDEMIKWPGSQADFISLVDYFQTIFSVSDKNVPKTADEICELFVKIIDVDFSPYPDFQTMRISVTGSTGPKDIVERVMNFVTRNKRQRDWMLNWMTTHDFINKLGKYIDLSDKVVGSA